MFSGFKTSEETNLTTAAARQLSLEQKSSKPRNALPSGLQLRGIALYHLTQSPKYFPQATKEMALRLPTGLGIDYQTPHCIQQKPPGLAEP